MSVLVLAWSVVGVLGGIAARDYLLGRAAARREARMLTEFPTVAELLALAVSAGEGAVGALERVCRLSHGELSDELRRCLADARAGANLPTALQGLADRTGLMSLTPVRRRHRRRGRTRHPARRGAAGPGAGRPRGRPPRSSWSRAARRRSA